jgi:hypothetical protein
MVFNATSNDMFQLYLSVQFYWLRNVKYTSPWTGFELTTLVVIGTDYIGRCKSNCHTITTMTAHFRWRNASVSYDMYHITLLYLSWGRCDHDGMVVEFTTIYAISVYITTKVNPPCTSVTCGRSVVFSASSCSLHQ